MAGDYDDIVSRLESIDADLTDRAMSLLRDAIESGNADAAAEEKRITRARRAVAKASVLLGGRGADSDD